MLIELGPRAVLGPLAALCWPVGEGSAGEPAVVWSQGASEVPGDRAFAEAVSRVYESGLSVSFAGLFAGEERRRVSLPAYPFQRERFWTRTGGRPAARDGHPLLGTSHRVANGELVFEREVLASSPEWLEEFGIQGLVVVPEGLYAAQALAAAGLAAPADSEARITDLEVETPMVLPVAGSGHRRSGTDPRPAGSRRADAGQPGPHVRRLQSGPR